MEKRKRGRPAGTRKYSDDFFIKFIAQNPKTANRILLDIRAKGIKLSWNTVVEYLDRMSEKGKIEKRRMGKYHLYNLPTPRS